MQPIRRLLLAALLLVATACGHSGPRQVVIFHTSDVHGQLASRPARWHEADPKRLVGGYGVLKRVVDREELPHILIDSGDIFQGTPEGNLTRGSASIEAMNAAGYTLAVIGNHDYDYGEPNLARLAKMAQFPMLAANVVHKGDEKPVEYASATHVVRRGGLTIGIVGVATRETAWSTLPANVAHLSFTDEVAAVRLHAEALRKAGADLVVAVTHCGLAPSQARKRLDPGELSLTASDEEYAGDLAIARGAPVDLVFGGHTHNGFDRPFVDPRSGVAIVNSFEGLVAVSRVVVTVDAGSRKVLSVKGELVDLWVDRYGEDPDVMAAVEKVRSEVGAALDERIGELTADLKRVENGLDSPLGNWVSDVIRETTKADIGIQNTYGLRADLFAGPLRIRDVYEVMPFENTIVVVEMTGAKVASAFETMLEGGKSKLQVSGLAVRARLATGGEKVVELAITHDGKPLDPARTYTVATNNYVVSAYEEFAGLVSREAGRSLRETIIEAVRARSPISPPPTGRLRIVEEIP